MAVFELAPCPAMQTKVRAEVDDPLHGRLPGYDDLKGMTYLNWFLKETLRLYLPLNAGPRICPGQQFDLLETSYVVLRFLQEHAGLDGLSNEAQPWTENYTLTCSVGQGAWLRLTKRELGQVSA
jgi:cytochrome P450